MPIDTARMQSIYNELAALTNDEGAKRIAALLAKGPAGVYPPLAQGSDSPAQFRARQSLVDDFFNRLLDMATQQHDPAYTVWLLTRWQAEKAALAAQLTPDNIQAHINDYTPTKYKEDHMGTIKTELIAAIDKTIREAQELHALQQQNGHAGNEDTFRQVMDSLNQLRDRVLHEDIPDTKDARDYADNLLGRLLVVRNQLPDVTSNVIVVAQLNKMPRATAFHGKPWKATAKPTKNTAPDMMAKAMVVEETLRLNAQYLRANKDEMLALLGAGVVIVEEDEEWQHYHALWLEAKQKAKDNPARAAVYRAQAAEYATEMNKKADQIERNNQRIRDRVKSMQNTIGEMLSLCGNINDLMQVDFANYDNLYARIVGSHINELPSQIAAFRSAVNAGNKEQARKIIIYMQALEAALSGITDIGMVDPNTESTPDTVNQIKAELDAGTSVQELLDMGYSAEELRAAGITEDAIRCAGSAEAPMGDSVGEDRDADTHTVNSDEVGAPNWDDLMDPDM